MADALTIAHALADAAHDTWEDVQHRSGLEEVVGMGADDTPTSRLDALLDESILDAAADFGIGTVSEESGRRDGDTPVWAYVDPLDGSRNAARGIPFFATTIAIADGEGAPALQAGVTKNLITGDTYAAAAGKGTHLNGKRPPQQPFDVQDMVVAVVGDSHTDIERELSRGIHIRDLGSAALELALVATGGIDAMVVGEPWLRSIDVAAGVILVKEAGGVVQAPHGGEVDLGFEVGKGIGILAARNAEAMEAA